MSRTPALVALALALAATAGCGEEEEDVSPNFEDRIPAGLELVAADRVVELGAETALRGTLEQGDEPLVDEAVRLEEDPYPFDGDYRTVVESTSDDGGAFSFRVEPGANTAYRVTTGEVSQTESKPRRVFVEPRTNLVTEPAGGGTRFETTFRHPPDRSIQGSSVFHYATTVAEAEATGELPFARITRVEQLRSGVSVADVAIAGASPEELVYMSCFGYTPDSGLGTPNSRCSQDSVAYEGG